MSSELYELREEIDRLERSAAKVALLETAIQLADSQGDEAQGFELREELVETACFTGFPQKMIVAYSWCLSQVDRNPQKFDEAQILWKYKWVVSALCDFPQISRQQLDEALADLQARFTRHGGSLRAVHKLRCTFVRTLGDRDAAPDAFQLWKKTPRGYLSDCEACDREGQFGTYLFLGQDKRALQTASPLLGGKLSCMSVPHTTRAVALKPMMRVGRWDQAAQTHRQGLPQVTGQLQFIDYIHHHLIYQLLTGKPFAAARLFENHLAMALSVGSPLRRFSFLQGAIFFCRQMLKADRLERKLRLPESFPLWNDEGEYDYGVLGAWFEREARTLADQFDERAGNRYRKEQLDALSELEKLTPPDTTASE